MQYNSVLQIWLRLKSVSMNFISSNPGRTATSLDNSLINSGLFFYISPLTLIYTLICTCHLVLACLFSSIINIQLLIFYIIPFLLLDIRIPALFDKTIWLPGCQLPSPKSFIALCFVVFSWQPLFGKVYFHQ